MVIAHRAGRRFCCAQNRRHVEAFFAVAASREPKMDRLRPAMLIAALVVDVGRRLGSATLGLWRLYVGAIIGRPNQSLLIYSAGTCSRHARLPIPAIKL